MPSAYIRRFNPHFSVSFSAFIRTLVSLIFLLTVLKNQSLNEWNWILINFSCSISYVYQSHWCTILISFHGSSSYCIAVCLSLVSLVCVYVCICMYMLVYLPIVLRPRPGFRIKATSSYFPRHLLLSCSNTYVTHPWSLPHTHTFSLISSKRIHLHTLFSFSPPHQTINAHLVTHSPPFSSLQKVYDYNFISWSCRVACTTKLLLIHLRQQLLWGSSTRSGGSDGLFSDLNKSPSNGFISSRVFRNTSELFGSL